MLVGATVPHSARLRDASGAERRDLPVQWSSSDPNVASVNQFGVMTAVRPGPVTIRAVAGSLSADRRYTVEANPVKSLTLSITAEQVKTGDVVEVSAMAFDANGYKVPNVPFLYTFTAAVEDSAVGQLAPAELDQKGRFVAQKAGDYQIIAVAPGLVAHRTVRVSNRDVGEAVRLVARAPAPGSQLSDFFEWRGRDGRELVLTCGAGTRGQLVSYEMTDAGLRALDTATRRRQGYDRLRRGRRDWHCRRRARRWQRPLVDRVVRRQRPARDQAIRHDRRRVGIDLGHRHLPEACSGRE